MYDLRYKLIGKKDNIPSTRMTSLPPVAQVSPIISTTSTMDYHDRVQREKRAASVFSRSRYQEETSHRHVSEVRPGSRTSVAHEKYRQDNIDSRYLRGRSPYYSSYKRRSPSRSRSPTKHYSHEGRSKSTSRPFNEVSTRRAPSPRDFTRCRSVGRSLHHKDTREPYFGYNRKSHHSTKDRRISPIRTPSRPVVSCLKQITIKQLFMAASKNSFGLLMDEEYNVFRIENSKGQIVHANNSWSLKMAMYGSTSTEGMVSKKYIINKYSATESFIIRVLVHYIRNCKVKLHTTIQTQQWMTQRFSDIEEYESLQREIKRMEMNHMSEALVLKPQRRSSVCLFRNNCSNYQSCVYCLLEAQKNHVNLKSGIRATKEMCVSKYDQGPLHRVVEDVAAEMRSRRPNVVAKPSSSSSSSSRSCSSSSSSSSEDE